MGVENAYVYPTGYFNLNGGNELYPGYPWIDLDAKTEAVLDELGYLHAPWIWLNEILDSSPFFSDDLTLQTSDGSKIRHWKIGELEWYWSHEGRMLELLKQEAPKIRERFSAAHFDVLTAGLVHEHFGSWPYDRAKDADFRNAMFQLFSGHDQGRRLRTEQRLVGSVQAFWYQQAPRSVWRRCSTLARASLATCFS